MHVFYTKFYWETLFCSCNSGDSFIPQLVVGDHSAANGDDFCGIQVDSSNWNTSLIIPITAVVDAKFDGEQEWTIVLSMTKETSDPSVLPYNKDIGYFDVSE